MPDPAKDTTQLSFRPPQLSFPSPQLSFRAQSRNPLAQLNDGSCGYAQDVADQSKFDKTIKAIEKKGNSE